MNPAAEAERLLQQLSEVVEELRQAVNSVLEIIPSWLGWVADQILKGWNWLCAKLEQLWAYLAELFARRGDPDALNAAADAWARSVGGPVSARAGTAEAGALRVDDMWAGTAADQYRQILPAQKGAMAAVETMTDAVGQALMSIKTGIYKFWGLVAVALAALIVSIIGAIASTATIFGAPAGPVIAAGGVVAFLAAVTGGVLALNGDVSAANNGLVKVLNDNTPYPAGRWPRGVL